MRKYNKAISQKEIKARLTYNEGTGEFYWLDGKRKGRQAGYNDTLGYRKINFEGKLYCAHRLAWLYAYGVYPNADVDHINGTPGDNRLSNLRLASASLNIANSKIRIDNKTGFKGVSINAKTGNYRAHIYKSGKTISLGTFATKEMAAEAYKQAAEIHFGQFARV